MIMVGGRWFLFVGFRRSGPVVGAIYLGFTSRDGTVRYLFFGRWVKGGDGWDAARLLISSGMVSDGVQRGWGSRRDILRGKVCKSSR